MTLEINENTRGRRFFEHLPENFRLPENAVEKRMLREYGAVFVARGVRLPESAMFENEFETGQFQQRADTATEVIGGIQVKLQKPALEQLNSAITEARSVGLTITPRGADAASRNFSDTVELWKSRVEPGLNHWVGQGKMTAAEAESIRGLAPAQQIPEIFRLEEKGLYFSKDLSKSIIYSVAPPGASQHLMLLAIDIVEHENERVRNLMERHGWFQTVVSDLPHFTYLGIPENEMSGCGLKKIEHQNRFYRLPDI